MMYHDHPSYERASVALEKNKCPHAWSDSFFVTAFDIPQAVDTCRLCLESRVRRIYGITRDKEQSK